VQGRAEHLPEEKWASTLVQRSLGT
jgi:hypothetical protein